MLYPVPDESNSTSQSMDCDHFQQHSPSFKQKIKHKICNYSCRFLNHNQIRSRTESELSVETSPTDHQINRHVTKNSPSSPSSWIKSRANDFLSEEIKERWHALFFRIARQASRRRSNSYDSSEFSYDPLSYALNFDSDDDTRFDEYPHVRDFSARLPQSPPRKVDNNRFQAAIVAATPRQVAACS